MAIIKPKKKDPRIDVIKLLSIYSLSNDANKEAKRIRIKFRIYTFKKFLLDNNLNKTIQMKAIVPQDNVKINVQIVYFELRKIIGK